MKITAAIITYNEEEMIEGCLKSVTWTDEKIVIDSRSQDNTVGIAKSLGAKTYIYPFTNFADMRNLAFIKATGDWILYLDADEIVTPELASFIRTQVKSQDYAAYKLRRKNFYLGTSWPYIEEIIRLFKRKNLKKWHGEIHESPIVDGSIGKIDAYLLHYTHRDLSPMVIKTNNWSDIEADLRLKANHPKVYWWRFIRIMITSFWEYYISQQGYKAGTVGLVESIYQSFSSFITYAKLWEKQSQGQTFKDSRSDLKKV